MILNDETKKFFWDRVKKTDRCWVWSGAKDQNGYGLAKIKISTNHWTTKRAHIISIIIHGIKIKKGLVCDHLCRNTQCVNPKHIEIVSIRENNIRGYGASGLNHRKKICDNGHYLSGDNVYLVKRHSRNGGIERVCKKCQKQRVKRYRSKCVSL